VWAAADCGGATIGPVGAGSADTPAATGRRAGVECRDSSRPAVPPTITTRPAAKAIAAGLRSGTLDPVVHLTAQPVTAQPEAAAHGDERARPDERQPRQRRSGTVPRGAAEPGGDRARRRLAGARGIF